jgi:hypothetical protein
MTQAELKAALETVRSQVTEEVMRGTDVLIAQLMDQYGEVDKPMDGESDDFANGPDYISPIKKSSVAPFPLVEGVGIGVVLKDNPPVLPLPLPPLGTKTLRKPNAPLIDDAEGLPILRDNPPASNPTLLGPDIKGPPAA